MAKSTKTNSEKTSSPKSDAKFPHADRAAGGDQCEVCSDPIEKNKIRIGIKRAVYVHPGCVGNAGVDRDAVVKSIRTSSELRPAEIKETLDRIKSGIKMADSDF
jgi:hypothetical protein